ncbi:uncharacterized protein LOC117168806 [Belonocnema kinseyi]|uniref:uncharacterized protein LOC117168806 n=1 Tax=Belonocnema kinseyi TaxID=2817044 RepID=UPI00143DE074|nr:uncharacterized protein LOC117168806 [Belonocnema kinseyi]
METINASDNSSGSQSSVDHCDFVEECTQKLAVLREELKALQVKLKKLEDGMKKLPKSKSMVNKSVNSGGKCSGAMKEVKKPYPNKKVSFKSEDELIADKKEDIKCQIQDVMEQLSGVKIATKSEDTATEESTSKSMDLLISTLGQRTSDDLIL